MCLRGMINIQIVQSRGVDRSSRHLCLHYPWRRHFAFNRNPEFFLWQKELTSLINLFEKSNFDSLYSRPVCHVVSKAFSMSKNTAAVDILLLKLRATWSVSLIHCSVVLWRARKPNWLALSMPLSSICSWRAFRFTFWNSFPVVDRG
jgi:hypothetical protein